MANGQDIQGRIFKNPQTGETAVWNGQQWVVKPPAESAAGEGPLGVVSPEFRTQTREDLESQSFGKQMFLQGGIPVGGAMMGASLGAPLGPLGVAGGAALGGTLGELFNQEVGISDPSRFALGMSAASPLLGGPVVARGARLGRRVVGALASKSPPIRAAAARAELEKGMEQAGSLATRILANQTGPMRRNSRVLFRAARMNRAPITTTDLPGTQKALDVLRNEARDFSSFPEGRQVLRAIRDIERSLNRGGEVTTETLGRMRQLVGASVGRLESQAGVKLGAAKRFFSAMSDDMDDLARGKGPIPTIGGQQEGRRRSALRFRKAAAQRAKLEFAVQDMESIIANATKAVRGEGDAVALNVKQVLDRINALTDPRSRSFNKNFTTALRDELPKVKELFQRMNELSTQGPAGPGSIVYRGITANIGRGIMSGALGLAGFSQGGALAGAGGAMLGAQLPEMVTSLMLTPTGRKAMERMARLGRGRINDKMWAVMSEIMAQHVNEVQREVGKLTQ